MPKSLLVTLVPIEKNNDEKFENQNADADDEREKIMNFMEDFKNSFTQGLRQTVKQSVQQGVQEAFNPP